MNTEEPPAPSVHVQLAEVSAAISRAAADLQAARVVIDRERTMYAANDTAPSRRLLLVATRVVDELRRTDEALADLLRELEARTAE